MIPFHYRRIGPEFLAELSDTVAAGQSAVLLGPHYVGKRYVLAQLEKNCRKRPLAPIVKVFVPSAQRLTTMAGLGALLRKAVQEADAASVMPEPPETDPFRPLDEFSARCGRPVVLLAANVDRMAHHVARRFLQEVRSRVEARNLIAVLTGEYDFRDLVHGPQSEFNCAHQFVLQGFEMTEYRRVLDRYARALRIQFEPGDRVVRLLWKLTGGSGYHLRLIVPRVIGCLSDSSEGADTRLGPEDVLRTLRDRGFQWTEWAYDHQHITRLIVTQPDCWKDLESLIRTGEAEVRWSESTPGPLEFAGVAVRRAGKLRFASPLLRSFTRIYYDTQRMGDLYARHGDWEEAFKRYETLSPEQTIRPADAEDRFDVEAVARAFSAALHTVVSEGPRQVEDLFAKGCRYVLGFPEVTFWGRQREWVAQRHGFPAGNEACNEIAAVLPTSESAPLGWFPLPEPHGRWALAAVLDDPILRRRGAVVLSDSRGRMAISLERERLTRELLASFVEAHSNAVEIEANRQRLQVRDRHVEILNAIIEALGSQVLDVKNVLTMAARELRKLGYGRVEFCLVDSRREWIHGVLDDSDAPGVDLADMTHYRLDKPKSDIQPYVASTGRPMILEDAAKEPLVNPAVLRAAGLRSIAVVPLLNRDNLAVGTVHVEREDGGVPSYEEVADIEAFGRQLATVIGQSERVNLLQTALDKIPEPLLIVDPLERLRYANRPAAELYGVEAGWRVQALPCREIADHIRNALAGHKQVRQITGLGNNPKYRGELLCEAILDWSGQVIGCAVHVLDQNSLQLVFDALTLVGRSDSAKAAQTALLEATRLLGHKSARLYLIDEESPDRFVSALSLGLEDPEHAMRFDHGLVSLPRLGPGHHSWQCVDEGRPLVFCWKPDLPDGSRIYTEHDLEAIVVSDPKCPPETGKKPGDLWVDVPLTVPEGLLGKIALDTDAGLRPERFEMLSVLAEHVAKLLVAFRERDRKLEAKELWVQAGFEASMSSIAHNLASRLASLPVLLARYRLRAADCDSIGPLNAEFENILRSAMSTIKRTKELLATIMLRVTMFDLKACIERALREALPPDGSWEMHCERLPFMVTADFHIIESLIAELIQNSLQFAPAPDKVRVTVYLEDFEREGREWVRMVFRDYGPGIRPGHKARIFEEFFSHRPGQKAGTGLGLAFVRRAVAAHGGSVSENGVYGDGAKFFVEFPRSAEEVSHE